MLHKVLLEVLSAKTSSLQIISSFTAHNSCFRSATKHWTISELCIFSRFIFHLKMYHAKATINLVTPRLATSCSFGSCGTMSKHHASNMLLSVALNLVCERVSKLDHSQDFTACNKAAAVSRQPSFFSLTFCSLFTSNSWAQQPQRLRYCSASRFLFCLLPCVDRWRRLCRALTSIQICNRMRFCQIPQRKLSSKLNSAGWCF